MAKKAWYLTIHVQNEANNYRKYDAEEHMYNGQGGAIEIMQVSDTSAVILSCVRVHTREMSHLVVSAVPTAPLLAIQQSAWYGTGICICLAWAEPQGWAGTHTRAIAPASDLYSLQHLLPLCCFSNPGTPPSSHSLSICLKKGYGQCLPHIYHKLLAPLFPLLFPALQSCSLQSRAPWQHLRYPFASDWYLVFSSVLLHLLTVI